MTQTKMKPMTVTIVIPTYRRAAKLAALVENIRETKPISASILVVTEIDDRETLAAARAANVEAIFNACERGYAGSINTAFRWSDAEVLFTGADDIRCRPGWVEKALARFGPGIGVVGTNDLDDPNSASGAHSTHSFVRRDYVNHPGAVVGMPGFVMYPGYGHYYTDVELVATAKARGAFAPCLESVVEHLRAQEMPSEEWLVKRHKFMLQDTPVFQQRSALWAERLRGFEA
jgi:glycosyltransferase involved in cell wall biosynthesis